MSRHFTSPPPVYARNWANGQNLVESTKIECQIVDSKKAHRKEKKEKKKEKKQKNEKSLEKHYKSIKQVSDESEQLEKSCLTDEHEQHHQVGYLSDGSQNSNKRRREASPAVESNIKATPVAGNPLRIRFVFKQPKDVEVVPQEDRVCSTSGADRPSEISRDAVSGHDVSLLPASLESDETAIPSESKKIKKHKTSKESRYSSLFDELIPTCISMVEDDISSSDDWLFGTRRQENASTKASICRDEEKRTMSLPISGDCSLPRARFLSEVGLFSLPYTVPF